MSIRHAAAIALTWALCASALVEAAERAVVVPRQDGTSKRYVIDRRLGSGALAEVYEGHDAATGEKVALKILHDRNQHGVVAGRPILEHEHLILERARAGARGAFPQSYGVGYTDDGTRRQALAMELVPGETLGTHPRLVSHRRSPGKAVRILIKLATDVDRLNRAGIAHNDIHPGNVKIVGDRSASARLIDVGYAGAYVPGAANEDLHSRQGHGLARLALALLTGKRSDDGSALASVPKVSARAADGSVVTLQEVIRAALRNEYATADAFALALRPFRAM
jgi:serine/threonine protein kinase